MEEQELTEHQVSELIIELTLDEGQVDQRTNSEPALDVCGQLSVEDILEQDLCVQEETRETEGKVRSFFKKMFGMGQEERTTEVTEESADETDEAMKNWDGDPFVSAGRLYGQDYEKIKKRFESSGELFVDRWFPPTAKSLFYTSPAPSFEWKRPHELCAEPKMFVNGADRFDINQGELGDCWLLAAMSSLAMDQDLLHQVVTPGQSFDKEDYTGAFRFRFWQYGDWVEVVVDDYLPTVEGKLVFMHSDSSNEFWSALWEKAYAKLNGSYEALKGGSISEAMVDFTGGCGEQYDLAPFRAANKDDKKAKDELFAILLYCQERRSLNGCSIEADPYTHEARTPQGLVKGHAYTITQVVKAGIKTKNVEGVIPLVRVRNPWGNGVEWKGVLSDNAKEWELILPQDKERLGIRFDMDGEWWMSFKDFLQQFDQLEICNLSPECLDACGHTQSKKLEVSCFNGAWIKGETAGGCRNFVETFASNPQYRVQLQDSDSDTDELCTLIVTLMQKHRRSMRDEGLGYLSIGFIIYRLDQSEEAAEKIGMDFFSRTPSIGRSKSFINQRQVSQRFRLAAGSYLILPSTFDPGHEGEFLMRTFCERR